ncbi:hypothetical protein T230_12015 [Tannerella sp. oral taxon BU063 isolate Cell 1/3]|uniref:Uncharacterized protein n=1 Tax=Tannerella sp. oral taxon BU063 isolate Cell 1/3 TaxID=1411022 RepID=W2CH03_9BACT|nr:hypothetical protein T230_12015 [Tannerella sp. oral taxon BU063 isolate Cell 1/3]
MGFKSVFGAILGEFWASNRFLVQSSAGLGLQFRFWRNPRVILGSKLIFGAILGGFWGPRVRVAAKSDNTITIKQ